MNLEKNIRNSRAMYQAILFLSRFVLSLWIVLVVSFLSLLLSNAPNVPDTAPFARVSLKTENNSTIYLPNRIFTCTETEQQFQCQTTIQNRCRALYNEQLVGCQEVDQTYAPILSGVYEITDLGLSSQQLQAVEQEHWGINTLMQMGDLRLMWISTGLSLAGGISAAFLAWMKPGKCSKAFTSFACGFGMCCVVLGLLGRVQYDVVIPYGFTSDTWNWFVYGGAIAAGVGTMMSIALLLWQRFKRLNRFAKILIGISGGMGIFSLCWLFLGWNFTYLFSFSGLATPLQNGEITMGFSAVLAMIAVILLWSRTNQSIKTFLCLGSGVGVVALATYLFMLILFELGYAD
jgi:hypothetical protein